MSTTTTTPQLAQDAAVGAHRLVQDAYDGLVAAYKVTGSTGMDAHRLAIAALASHAPTVSLAKSIVGEAAAQAAEARGAEAARAADAAMADRIKDRMAARGARSNLL